MNGFKQSVKRLAFRLLGKDPEAVVVTFLTGEEPLARSMAREIQGLVPERRHFAVCAGPSGEVAGATLVSLSPGSTWSLYRQLRRHFRALRVGQAAVLISPDCAHSPLRRAAFLLAPRKILSYNTRLERHHLRLRTMLASWLFVRGVPLDRIFLRPWWLFPWKRRRPAASLAYRILEGRPLSGARRRVAVLSPYFPYPLSHGGAVRLYHLLKEASREFDIFLFAFQEEGNTDEYGPVLEFCAKTVLVAKPRYREPCWSSGLPPEVCEYRSKIMRQLLERIRREYKIGLLQVEYTQLASYGGDILVEHDVTFDLYRQVFEKRRTVSSWWDFVRWRRFERRALRRYRRVTVMSEKDAELLSLPNVRTIPNGVDLDRFQPRPESPGRRLLFIGSFRHFPNIVAYRFFVEQVWPLLRSRFPDMLLTVVAGADPLTYWRASQDSTAPAADGRIRLLEFVRDVRPLYVETNLVVVPTLVSAGTNLKVLEAMAMERAVVSTACGCAGLGLEHGKSVWIADEPAAFAEAVARLIEDEELRRRLAEKARGLAARKFAWRRLGREQCALWSEFLPSQVSVREAGPGDLDRIREIQEASPEAAQWDPRSYLNHRCLVGDFESKVAGFLVCREVAAGEHEILNLAVAPPFRRYGVATTLIRQLVTGEAGSFYLEVRRSNAAARRLYEGLGFRQSGLRPRYYQEPEEDGIVMTL